jgi:hypothetical protein
VTDIVLNQTLHGYADGHQLIASSTDLTRDQQTLLLVMSDLSGPAFRTGFESYLTGYPLKTSGFYCFARTWFAPELPRPGCVWTHTLIVKNEDLARIQSFSALNDVFRRPEYPEVFERYESEIVLGDSAARRPVLRAKDGREIMWGLYETERQIVVPTDAPRTYEDFVLALLDQQWPRLRRNFKFCTGALSIRETEFDLSMSPPEITHSIGTQGLIVKAGMDRSSTSAAWLDLAEEDLYADLSQFEYRRFLWHFGPDFTEGRATFRPLTEFFVALQTRDIKRIGDRFLSMLARFFPEQQDAKRLKSELFGLAGEYVWKFGDEEAVTRLLTTHSSANVLGRDTAALKARAIRQCRRNLAVATDLAGQAAQEHDDRAQQFLEGYFEYAHTSDEAILLMPARLLVQMSNDYPTIITNASLWGRKDYFDIVRQVLARLRLNSGEMRRAVESMIGARAWDALDLVVKEFDADALVQILAVVEASKSETLEYAAQFYKVIASRPYTLRGLIKERKIGPKAIRLLSSELDPRPFSVEDDLMPFVEAANLQIPFLENRRSIRSHVFFFCIGLASRGPNAAILLAYSFTSVYEAAKADAIADMWDDVEPLMVWRNPSWDKCGKLVKTVARAFLDESLPLVYFPKTFVREEEFSRALAELDDRRDGRRYIRRLRDAGLSGELSWSEEQAALLTEFA